MYTESKQLFSPAWLAETGLAAADTLIAWVADHDFEIVKVSFVVTTALGTFTSTAPILALSVTPSGGTIEEKATITLVAESAVGTETEGAMTSERLPCDVREGDTVTFAVKTAGSGGTTTGAGYWVLEIRPIPGNASA